VSQRATSPPTRHRRNGLFGRSALVFAVLSTIGFTLAACGSGADSLGDQACTHVERSITLYDSSLKATGARAAELASEANTQLRAALQPASLAASGGGSWQPLAATLAESSQVPERDLVPALTAQCASSPAGGNS
jgi:hypothetical protein